MTCFVDTSALYALLDRDDEHHPRAGAVWNKLLQAGDVLVTTNYVLVETLALVQHRLGIDAVRTFYEDICPVLRVEWVDSATHGAAVEAVLSARRRTLSMVDCAGFIVMRRLGIRRAFAFDPHFAQHGFKAPGAR